MATRLTASSVGAPTVDTATFVGMEAKILAGIDYHAAKAGTPFVGNAVLPRQSWGVASLGWFPDNVPTKAAETFTSKSTAGRGIDLRDHAAPIVTQDGLNDCVPSATCAALEILSHERYGVAVPLSRLYLYYRTRKQDNVVDRNVGSSVRATLKMCRTAGVCYESLWPHSAANMAVVPPATATRDAANHKMSYCKRVTTWENATRALDRGMPVIFGAFIFSDFVYGNAAKQGVAHLPAGKEYPLGGHMLCCVGYDGDWAIVRNSWGTGWGDGGYVMMPKEYVFHHRFNDDQWVIVGGGWF